MTVDAPLRLDLHDLEYAKYERRRDRLLLLISERLGPDTKPDSTDWNDRVEFLLEPPSPPRLEISDGLAPIRGIESAPVTIVEFVDFESAHCRRLQPELIRILDHYPDRVRVLIHDLPLPYHRYAWEAASSVHCAAEQDAYWEYHDLLLLEQPKLSPADRSRYADLVGLEVEAFEACVASRRHDSRITADVALAASLGVRRAATLFVNGLYLPGRPSHEDIERVVRGELARLGIDPTPSVTDSSAVDEDESALAEAETRRVPGMPKIPPDLLNEPESVVTLSRAEVDLALRDRRKLDRKLEATSHEFSGQRLLKVRTVDDGGFYARLGLEESDVLMVVNGEFLTLDHNSIWEAFENEGKVTILIMRRGLPHTYEYRIR
jgi:protein-disulfide isomerase